MNLQLWCLDCDRLALGNSQRECGACGSRALYPVHAWINRNPFFEERETGIQRYWRKEAEREKREVAELERLIR